MAESLFTLNNVSYSYSGTIPALSGITLSINRGERVAVIGANGTGKSTLLTMLDALIFPDTGTVCALGTCITKRSMNDAAFQRLFRSKVGFVFQNPDVQLFCSTVREDILFGPLQLGIEKEVIKRRFNNVIECMRFTDILERSPHQLSAGEKKKAALASVLIIEPDVLLLDEPTSGLDPQTMRDIIAILCNYHKEGKTVVIATQDLHIVEEMADLVYVFNNNHTIIYSGIPEDALSDQILLQANNLAHIHSHRHRHIHHVHPH